MKLISVNVSQPKAIIFKGKAVETSIFKEPIKTPINVSRENIAGNLQADLKNHGGPDKAVYAYGLNHYPYWKNYINTNTELTYGSLGETLSFDILDENHLCIGDQIQIDNVILAVTQFRVPCFKLAAKFNKPEIVAQFIEYAHTGAYFKVLQEGSINTHSEIKVIQQDPFKVPLKDLFEACFKPKTHQNRALLERASQIEHLSDEWRTKILRKINY